MLRHFGIEYKRRKPDMGVKIDHPDFEGRMYPDEFICWLQTVERVFDYKVVPLDRRVKL